MNPIKLSKQLQETLVNYLTTTFDVNKDGKEPNLAAFIRRSFNRPRALFAGPYLELTAPYQTSDTLQGLAEEGVISSRLLDMSCFQQGKPLPVDAPLYTHQALAIRKLCDSINPRNIVVSSGTGSGKTECFLIPILNDLLIDPTPGVRAVLIYPLNALVNDQLDRLRILLRDTNITFGRYTSELEAKAERARKQMEKEWQEMEPQRRQLFPKYPLPNEIIGRDQIQEQGQLPQILITNYAMLEYLLLRPQDNPLFTQGTWRFVVLDEAHTYAGAQGIEVGLLMRRLKHRLGHQPGEMRCIATSATLTNDDKSEACQFAEALFGEQFIPDDVIFGEPNHDYVPPSEPYQPTVGAYVHELFGDLLQNVRQEKWENADELALLMQEIGLITENQLSLADRYAPPKFLWEALRGNQDLARLRKYMVERGQPVEVAAVAEKIFDQLPPDQQQTALYHLIELAAMARRDVDEPSLLPARYHLFVRPPQGIWACINPACPAKPEGEQWSKLFGDPRETCDVCHSPVYPLVVCRSCGQIYLRLQKVGKQYLPEAALELEPRKNYVTWRAVNENRAIADNEDDDEDLLVEQSGETVITQSEFRLCLHCQQKVAANGRCGCSEQSSQVAILYLVEKERPVTRGKSKGVEKGEVVHLDECARCHSRALKSSEIATDITMSALTPLAVLTDELYRALPESNERDIRSKPGNGRKLLSFYDSRQGAARFAAFIQDIVNQQAYRRIIREAAEITATTNFHPDLEKISRVSLDLALNYRVVHNDPDIGKGDLPRDSQYLSRSQERRLVEHMRKQVFAEVTTQLRSRQSLEALGLINVTYFEPDNLPDFRNLALKLQLTEQETRTLVEYLLDDLRRGKVVSLPDGVKRDDLIFGRNKFSPRLVRANANHTEIAWIGQTTRHRRFQLVQKVLQYKELAYDETAVKQALTDILEWLIQTSGVLDTSRPSDGYQIRHDRLFFQANAQWYRCDQCQRLNSRGNTLPCPHPHCQGTLRPIAIEQFDDRNFYYDNLRQPLIPMRVEEHTAQLDPEKGRRYQNQFKAGDVNMLSCSTTFEMGIDLGDLQAVVMSNIPPTVANYKQRAGRAGRRTSGTALILAWASNRPHDQAYFKAPAEIINGHVRVPFIDIQNPIIIRRHINALLLSEFLRYCATQREFDKSAGSFFDDQTPGGAYYTLFSQWLMHQRDRLLDLLLGFGKTVKQTIDPGISLRMFEQDLQEKGYVYYHDEASYRRQTLEALGKQQLELIMQGNTQTDGISREIKQHSNLLERLRSEDIINFLSDRGVLPSYSFPLHTVELRIPPHLIPQKELRLQRNLKQAIREYAPGQEVVADKRIWKSEALEIRKEPQVFAYHICPVCNHLRLERTPHKDLEELEQPCPVCGTVPKGGRWKQQQYIQPHGFRASNDSGQPAGQYVDRPFNLMRSALLPGPVDTDKFGDVLSIGYDRSGALLYVNEGFRGGGFKICPRCGKHITTSTGKCDGVLNGQPCTGQALRNQTRTLGFEQDTDTLHLKFSSTEYIALPDPNNTSFWVSLLYALLQGASRALQIERKDIDGVLFPEKTASGWQQTVVLYDSVPGGAGHVKRIQEEIRQVIAASLEIVDCDCEKSCYRCLREYGNQWEHHLLERKPVAEFLRALDADLQQGAGDVDGMYRVVAIDQAAWLWNRIEQATESVMIALDALEYEPLSMGNRSWLDLLQDLLQRRVSVYLYLSQLPDRNSGNTTNIALVTHLRLLVRKGLDLRLTNSRVPLLAIIDANAPDAYAVKSANGDAFVLGRENESQLYFTQDKLTIRTIQEQVQEYRGHVVEHEDLREQPDTRVVEVIPDGKPRSETDFFADFYGSPVRGMVVSDRYLDQERVILDRLGSHLSLAQRQGALEWVVIHTRPGQEAQRRAFHQLKSQFPQVSIKLKTDPYTVHDRFIELTRADGSKARVIIGMGLDFVQPDGRVRRTFLIFQDPYKGGGS